MVNVADNAQIVSFTTPTLDIKIKAGNNLVLSEFKEIHVTLAQGSKVVDIVSPTILSEDTLRVELTQEQTSQFVSWQPVKMMVNLVAYSDKRFANKNPIMFMIVDNLLKRVI